jgi:cytochrome c-type biogenesis protein CcmH/NrfG
VLTKRGLEMKSPTANFRENLQERPKDIKKSDFLGRILKGLLS